MQALFKESQTNDISRVLSLVSNNQIWLLINCRDNYKTENGVVHLQIKKECKIKRGQDNVTAYIMTCLMVIA